MPKALELRKVIKLLARFGIIYVTGSGRHPKFYEPHSDEEIISDQVSWQENHDFILCA